MSFLCKDECSFSNSLKLNFHQKKKSAGHTEEGNLSSLWGGLEELGQRILLEEETFVTDLKGCVKLVYKNICDERYRK